MNTFSDRVREILEWPVIRDELVRRASTPLCEEIIDALAPLPRDRIIRQMRKISEIKELAMRGEAVDFSGVSDIRPLLDLADREAVLRIEDLVSVRHFILASGSIRAFLGKRKEEFPSLAEEYGRLDRLEEIGEVIVPALTDSNELSTARFPELKRLRNDLFAARHDIEKRLNKMMGSPHTEKLLQEKMFTTRNGRYVLLIKSNMMGRLGGTVHDISASGSTYYLEPDEIIPLNNRAISLERELQAEIERILQILTYAVKDHSEALRANLEQAAYLDLLNAAARFSRAVKGAEPEIIEEPRLRILAAHHPVLYLMMKDDVIANDIEIGGDYACLIISGANTGGKTVLLKTMGLCVMMAMFGLHVPAGPDSQIGMFTDILADIGDDQNLSRSLSTFSGQVVVLKEMLERADSGTLVIIDEIMVGTNPRQGAALAQAILEGLVETGARIVATTHYSELKELATRDTRFRNASVSFDPDNLRPTYRLAVGLPGVSYALEIAGNYGLPRRLVDRSRELLDGREISMEALIETTQKYEQEIEEQKNRLREQNEELSRRVREYEEKQRDLRRAVQEAKRGEGIAFIEELREQRRLIAERIAELQGADMKTAGEIQQDLSSLQENVAEELERTEREKYTDLYSPFDSAHAVTGDRVFIIPLKKEGKIDGLDLEKGTATVLFGGSIRSRYAFEELLSPRGVQQREPSPRSRPKGEPAPSFPEYTIPVTIQTSFNTVDLRGMRVEESIRAMEEGFDRMVRQSIRFAVVIHGHGTGALKEAVRQNLKNSLYAAEWRPGDPSEGGDGVTLVRLRT